MQSLVAFPFVPHVQATLVADSGTRQLSELGDREEVELRIDRMHSEVSDILATFGEGGLNKPKKVLSFLRDVK